uniref:Beta-galactosidase n=1 Tax=Macrostomum lignano TaxID=282301 RepID=A0A1I8F5U2_9PLAT
NNCPNTGPNTWIGHSFTHGSTSVADFAFAAHSYSALRAGRAELGSGGGLPGKGHLCVSFRQCCSGYCLPINASNRWPDRPSSSALTTALTTEAAPWKGNLKVRKCTGGTSSGTPVVLEPHAPVVLRVREARPSTAFTVTVEPSAATGSHKHDSGLRRQPALLEHEPVRLHPVIGEGRLGRQLHDAGVQHQGVHAGVGQVALDELAHGLVAGQVQPRAAHLRVHRPVANVVGNVVAFLQARITGGAPPGEVLGRGQADAWVAPVTTTRAMKVDMFPGGLGRGVQQSQTAEKEGLRNSPGSSKRWRPESSGWNEEDQRWAL